MTAPPKVGYTYTNFAINGRYISIVGLITVAEIGHDAAPPRLADPENGDPVAIARRSASAA